MNAPYTFGPFVLEPAHRRLTLRSGEGVPLTAKPFDALVCLVERAGLVVQREELMKVLWHGRVVEDNNLSQVVGEIRRALGDTGPKYQFVATVPRRGYQFIANVSSLAPHAHDSSPRAWPGSMPPNSSRMPPSRAPSRIVFWGIMLVAAVLLMARFPLQERDAVEILGGAADRVSRPQPGYDRTTMPACSEVMRQSCVARREAERAFQHRRKLGLSES